MTNLKKLLIALTLALGLQFSAGASTDNDIETQNSIILVFAQDLLNQNNKQAQTIGTWLNAQVINRNEYSNRAIVEIIRNNNLAEQSKLILFSAMIEKQKNDATRNITENIGGALVLTGALGILAWAIINHPMMVYSPGLGETRQQVNIYSR